MTDLEMVKLCADAMGIKVIKFSRNDPSCTYRLEDGKNYYPPHDDAQAMALVKKFRLLIAPGVEQGKDIWSSQGDLEDSYAESESLNRAIVECVAKMQAAKERK